MFMIEMKFIADFFYLLFFMEEAEEKKGIWLFEVARLEAFEFLCALFILLCELFMLKRLNRKCEMIGSLIEVGTVLI